MRATPIGSDPANSLRTGVNPQRSSTWSTRARRTFSRRRRVGKETRSASSPPPPPCHSSAVSTFSSTVSQPNVCTRWKVRLRPRRARSLADLLVRSTPSITMRPPFGYRTPETTSNSVVLPAPFGTDHPDHLAGVGVDADVVQRDDATEVHGDPGDVQNRTGRGGGLVSATGIDADPQRPFPLRVGRGALSRESVSLTWRVPVCSRRTMDTPDPRVRKCTQTPPRKVTGDPRRKDRHGPGTLREGRDRHRWRLGDRQGNRGAVPRRGRARRDRRRRS